MALEYLGNIKGPKGDKGDQGDQGLAGVNGVANDTATGSYIDSPTSVTRTALKAATDTIAAAKVADITSSLRKALDLVYAQFPSAVTNPVGFGWTTNPLAGTITSAVDGTFSTTFDITTKKVTGGVTYYVDIAAGSDANNGTTAGTAFKTFAYALSKADARTINVAAGLYTRTDWAGVAITHDLNIIGTGNVRFSCHDALSWTLSSGKTYTYQAARSAVGQVGDFAADPIRGTRYVNVTSITAVEATAGSWFTDGTTIYVHTYNNRAVDANVRAFLTTPGLQIAADITLYVEGVTVHGGLSPLDLRAPTGGVGPTVYLNTVNAGYSGTDDNIRALGTKLIVSVNCDSYNANLDGFGYHVFNGVIPKAVEIGCRAFNNGGQPFGRGTNSDNGSTAHDGATVIRLNGAYFTNDGSNVADVTDGTQSWNLGCEAYASTTQNDWFFTLGAVTAWMDRCSGKTSAQSISITSPAVAYARRCSFERVDGVLTAY